VQEQGSKIDREVIVMTANPWAHDDDHSDDGYGYSREQIARELSDCPTEAEE
jgi:hypothetical protein